MRAKVKLRAPTDEEEVRIQAGIAQDPDAAELTDEELARMRPAREVMAPETLAALKKARYRGPQKEPTKRAISIRLDQDVLDKLRATGPGWQGRANDILRKAVVG